jgi:hypothetical protein
MPRYSATWQESGFGKEFLLFIGFENQWNGPEFLPYFARYTLLVSKNEGVLELMSSQSF